MNKDSNIHIVSGSKYFIKEPTILSLMIKENRPKSHGPFTIEETGTEKLSDVSKATQTKAIHDRLATHRKLSSGEEPPVSHRFHRKAPLVSTSTVLLPNLQTAR